MRPRASPLGDRPPDPRPSRHRMETTAHDSSPRPPINHYLKNPHHSNHITPDRVGPPRLAGLQRRPLDAFGVARGGPGPCSLVDLRLPHPRAQSLRVDAQPAGDPPDRPLRPRGVSQGLHRHPRRPIPQPDRVPPLPPYAAIPLPPLPPPNPGHNSDIFCRHGPCRRPDSPARSEPVPTVHPCLGPPRTRTPANPEAADTGSP